MNGTNLTNIVIYRWYDIGKIEIPITGTALFSARNKVGKSTILDAIKYAMTTSQKFNRAANVNDERDVNSYIRRYQDGESSIDGFLTSNIALEFTKSNGKKSITGVIIDSPCDKKIEPSWYFVNGSINDLVFEKDSIVLDKKAFRSINKIDVDNFVDGPKAARQKLRAKHDIKDFDIYAEKIDQLAAYNPPKNIKSFYKDILKQDDVVIDPLITSITSVKEIIKELEDMEASLKYLENVKLSGDKYREIKRSMEEKICLAKLIELKIKEKRSDEASKQNLSLLKTVDVDEKNIERLKDEIANAKDELYVLEKGNETIKHYENAINTAENENKKLINDVNVLKENVSNVEALLLTFKDTESSYADFNFDFPPELVEFFSLGKEETSTEIVMKEINDLKYSIKELSKYITKKISAIDADIETYTERSNSLINQRKSLDSGNTVYPYSDITTLKNAIEKEFKKRGIKDEVKVLCDLVVSVKDKSWAETIETYLGNNRFALIVEPQNITIAQEVQGKLDLFDAVLVSTDRLQTEINTNENSLFSLLNINNIHAKRYLYYLLNNVMMCNDIHDFKKYNIGIMRNGHCYRAYTTRKMKPAKHYYFGKEAKKKQFEQICNEIKDVEAELKVLKELKSKLLILEAAIDRVNLNTIEFNVDSYNLLTKNKAHLSELHDTLNSLKTSDDITRTIIRIDALKKKIDSLENEMAETYKRISSNEVLIQTNEEIINNNSVDIPKLQEEYEEKLKEYGFVNTEIESKCSSFNKSNINIEYYQKKLEDAAQNLRKTMAEYQNKTRGSFSCEVSDLPKYLEHYEDLKNIQYQRLKDRLEEEKRDINGYLRNDLINGLRERFDTATRMVNQINKNLKESFEKIENSEYYILKLMPTNDPELKAIYDIVKITENDGLVLNEESVKKLDEIINSFIEDTSNLEEFQEKICDYRNYYDCDIRIRDVINNKETSLVKRKNSTSGMESQAPYYIIASICIKLSTNDDSPSVIVIDEAFDKMDAKNIKKMMNFFKYQNQQIIMATPPEKIENMQEYLDELVPLAKDKDNLLLYTNIQYFRSDKNDNV